tara:strand:- start:1692 stop:2144 length:453 start_codon:yes stop_codon:yes gene_type:complete
MAVLEDLAKEIMECEFDNDSELNSLQSIECWLEANLGLLNTMINTSFCIDAQELDSEAQAVYKQLYLYNYYSKKARNALRGIIGTCETDSNSIASISDGESRVTFTNKNETAKVIRGMAGDAKASLDMLVGQYNMYQSEPRQVGGIEAAE